MIRTTDEQADRESAIDLICGLAIEFRAAESLQGVPANDFQQHLRPIRPKVPADLSHWASSHYLHKRPPRISMLKQVLCIKWGTKYGPEYVNRIYGMVSRNVTPPFRVNCFTDDTSGIRSEVNCYDLPELGCPVPTNTPGIWRKTALWGGELFDLKGVALFLDLDVVVTGNLDDLFSYGSPDDVVLARNWVRPLERLGQTSVFRYPIGKHAYLLHDLQRDPEGIAGRYQFEQRYVTQCVRGGVKFFPSSWIKLFRLNCLGPWPMRYLRPAVLPRSARVVMFPGRPDPSDAIVGRWSDRHQHWPPLVHLRNLFGSQRRGSILGHFKRYVRPVPWVAEHWRE